jgi:hypothetical protein
MDFLNPQMEQITESSVPTLYLDGGSLKSLEWNTENFVPAHLDDGISAPLNGRDS